jgi:predicted site-specific integrase-resolvase
MTRYVTPPEACKLLSVSEKTLRNGDEAGKIKTIRTPTNQRRYDIDSMLSEGIDSRITALYCRVSSAKQKEDLSRQISHLQGIYPQGQVFKDIGAGLNFKRKSLLSLLGQVMSGTVSQIVVGHQNRLARFGCDLIRWICEQNDCKLVVLGRTDLSPEREMVEDILAIIHVFSCRLYGLGKYKSTIKEDPSLPGNEISSNLENLDSCESLVLQPSNRYP